MSLFLLEVFSLLVGQGSESLNWSSSALLEWPGICPRPVRMLQPSAWTALLMDSACAASTLLQGLWLESSL